MAGAGADYDYLPPINATAVADTTGNNAGNWTAQIATTNYGISYLSQFECFKMTIDGPIGFGMAVYIDNKKWSHTSQGWQNEWDPQQVMPLKAGQTIYFYWEAADTILPVPTVTCWFRYDTNLPGSAT